MLWRVRANLPDRPGSLAALTSTCGEAGVDIRRIRVLAGPRGETDEHADGTVTDELVVEAPQALDEGGVGALVAAAGGHTVIVMPCTPAALTDQPTRYVEAARSVIAEPASFPDVVARLFDADTAVDDGPADVMELRIGDVRVQIRRPAPFTATERERGLAMASLVSDVLGRERSAVGPARRTGAPTRVAYEVRESVVVAVADLEEVGRAGLLPASHDEPGTREIDLVVDPSWRRCGVGTRLLGDVARLARTIGADELLVRTRADNQAVMALVLSAGMRGRIRMAGDELSVRVLLRDVRPFD